MRKQSVWILILLLVIQVVLTNNYLPFEKIWDKNPVITYDYPLHLHSLQLMRDSLSMGKPSIIPYDFSAGIGFWGYAPKFFHLGILSFSLPNLNLTILFKLYLFISNLFLPFFLYLTSRNFGISKRGSIISLGIAIILWNFSSVHSYNSYGLLPFFEFVVMWLFAVSFIVKYCITGKKKLLWISTILLVGTYPLHEYFFPLSAPLIFLLISYIILKFKSNWKYLLLALNVLTALFLVFAAWEIVGTPLSVFHQESGFSEVLFEIQSSPLPTIVLILGLLGLVYSPLKKPILFVIIPFLLIGFFGGGKPLIWMLHPQRFQFLAFFLMVPFSALFLEKLFLKKMWLLGLTLLFLLVYVCLSSYSPREIWEQKLSTEPPENTVRLLGWLSNNTDNNGRILLEGSGTRSGHIYGGSYPSLFPSILHREFASNEFHYVNADLHYLSLGEGDLLCDGRVNDNGNVINLPIQTLQCEDLVSYIDIFNVHWAVIWDNNSKERFSTCPEFKQTAEIGNFSIFEPIVKPTYFYLGNGSISEDKKGALFLKSTAKMVVLKYRWAPQLTKFGVFPFKANVFGKFNMTLIEINNPGESVLLPFYMNNNGELLAR